MDSFLNELSSTEKSYAVPFKEIPLCLTFLKSFDTLPIQNFANLFILRLEFAYLCFLYIQVTIITIIM